MDLKNTRDLSKIIAFCRKNGITSLKSGEFAVELAPSALFPESDYKKKKADLENAMPSTPQLTEDDILFWSSAGIPDTAGAN